MNTSKTVIAALLLAAAPLFADTETYKPGDAVETFTVNDQHEKAYTLEPGVETIVVSFDMGNGRKANSWFEKKGTGFLEEHHAVYIANINGMPGIGRMFALPKMRKYPHRILLAETGETLTRFPKEDDKLTVIHLDADEKVTSVEFVDPKDGLSTVFK
jgi:nitrous oxide reductase accessory protein NosL